MRDRKDQYGKACISWPELLYPVIKDNLLRDGAVQKSSSQPLARTIPQAEVGVDSSVRNVGEPDPASLSLGSRSMAA